ncbi:hypothetical protein Hanom_Chr03g00266631 [Helianthus anomalus]
MRCNLVSLGLLPATMSLVTTGCGTIKVGTSCGRSWIKNPGLPVEEAGEMDNGKFRGGNTDPFRFWAWVSVVQPTKPVYNFT